MRHPKILDVMHAVREVARAREGVRSFWYAPQRRLHLAGRGADGGPVPKLEVVVEPRSSAAPDLEAIARDLSRLLHPVEVAVRAYLGDAEERHLFRLISCEEDRES